MGTLFTEPQKFNLPDADIVYYPQLFDQEEADSLFSHLKKSIAWQQDDIKVFGKVYPQPRLTALYAANEKPYGYANIVMQPKLFSKELLRIKTKVEEHSPVTFTTCLLNLYRDGQDSNGWHADDEKELGKNPIIASVTFGQERWFHLRYKKDKAIKQKILLQHGSLLLMAGTTQHFWQHQIPKTAKKIGERINLTFRVIT